MLILIDRRLRRPRRRAMIELAVPALAGVVLTAHLELMSGPDTHVTHAAGVGLIVGAARP